MAGKIPAPKVFNCPKCGAGLLIRAQGLTVSIACRSCGSVLDATDENYRVISQASQKLNIEPLIPLGQRGKVHGVLWEVIGFMQRSDESGVYKWCEYLLFNPLKGFRWLTEFDGHWNYVVQTKEKPIVLSTSGSGASVVRIEGKDYTLFHKGKAKVTYVIGEFYWRVKEGETVDVEDFISPPEILSSEKNAEEIVWSIGEYISSDTIKTAFQVIKEMPFPFGVAPNQPSTLSALSPTIFKYWIVFMAVLFTIQLGSSSFVKSEKVFEGNFIYQENDPEKQKMSPQFELKSNQTNLEIELSSPVRNSWLEVESILVNDQTGESYELSQGVEYYSGQDSEGYWAEGSQSSSATFSAVPAGKYHLNFQATGGKDLGGNSMGSISGQPYTVTAIQGANNWSNFIFFSFILSIFPVWVWWRDRSFERDRWSTSDFSPYWSEEE